MTQIQTFLSCAAFGIVAGLFYELFYILLRPVRRRVILMIGDVVFCILCGLGFVWFSVAIRLGALRGYMIFACVVGFFLYRKSFHKTVAFFVEKGYNKIAERKLKQRKNRLWEKIASRCRRKKQKESP